MHLEGRHLLDAWTWPPFGDEILRRLCNSSAADAPLQFWHDAAFDITPPPPASIPTHEQSNSTVQYANRFFLKAFRLVAPGIHPEEEIGRFLTNANFPHTVPLRGGIRWQRESQSTTLALLFDYAWCNGSLWDWMLSEAKSVLLERNLPTHILSLARDIGICTAELHQAVAQPQPTLHSGQKSLLLTTCRNFEIA